MEHGHAAAEVLAEDDERRARDVDGVDAEAHRHAAGQHGLARSKLAPQREDVVRLSELAEAFAEAFGVERGMANEIDRICVAQGSSES